MIKHIVMWTLREEANSALKTENIKKLKAKLETLPAIISDIDYFEVGVNFNPGDAAFDIVLVSHFADNDALQRYQTHPEHVKVAEFVGRVRDKRAVVDYVM